MKSKKLSETIIKNFKKNGFVLSDPDVLLDSDYIIERSGEKFRSSMLSFDREDGSAIQSRLNAQLVLEDDYVKVFNWLAKFEASVPAARVSSCKLSKGQSGNDLRMDLSLDLPITNEGKAKNTKA